ncbi:hypothetical protein [Cesiribacter sp. SM1]|uniref:hypothetical protein n=1 Tax=Cesiribacter sp. SM1 TaxID=2861196 RepID=UPI001CD30D79|nr:hypothetical protein [Cesiribacter sp. SM1]
MQIFSIDQLKEAIEAKARHRRMLEQIKQRRLRAIQQLDKEINKLRLEESLLQQDMRKQQQENIKQALLNHF